jgi:spore maturation protein CgeB
MRLFEATGSGALLLTDYSDSLNTYFEPEKEVITFKTKEEAADKVKYYLKNDTIRTAIAKRGQEKTLKNYNYDVLCEKMLGFFHKMLNI